MQDQSIRNSISKGRENHCLVYLDSYVQKDKGVYDVFIDFRQEEDYSLFCGITNVEKSDATFLELRSLKVSKRLFEGSYYNLNLDVVKGYQIQRVEDSYIIGGIYDLSSMSTPKSEKEEILQGSVRPDSSELSFVYVPTEPAFNLVPQNDLKLFVKNVGQANWNELRSGDKVIALYDAGAPLWASKQEVEIIIKSRYDDLKKSKPVLVISHWDKDHIHCLKALSSNDIQDCFSKMICVDKRMSNTSIDVFKKIKDALGVANIYSLRPMPRTNGILMHHWQTNGPICPFRI